MNFLQRIKKLEEKVLGGSFTAKLKDGSITTIKGDKLLDYACDAIEGRRTPEVEKILLVSSSNEDGQMIELIQALGAGPAEGENES
jgi:hypothetical protein